MSTGKFGIAAMIVALALSTAAFAATKGGGKAAGGGGHASGGGGHAGSGGHAAGGARFGGGAARPVGARPAFSRSAARPSSARTRSLAVRQPANNSVGERTSASSGEAARKANINPNIKANAVRNTLNSPSVAGALRDTRAFRSSTGRARITASAATAGWHGGRDGANGWWRHGNGGYGWVGPLYWPFAYYDMYDYAMWGYGDDDSFWGYGYGDIYAGIFAPYGYDDLTGYLPQNTSSNPGDQSQPAPASAAPGQLAQMCGSDSRDIAGLPIDQFQQAIQPTDAQRAALDELANASVKAASDIRAACPTDIALTAPSRLAAMQQRIESMIAAVQTVQPPLEAFYALLNDEQKAKLTALGDDRSKTKPKPGDLTGALPAACGTAPSGVMAWPTAEIDQTVRPTDAQRAGLAALQSATTQAAELLKASCPPGDPLTPPARLAAVGQRLDTMLQAVKTVSLALNDFYGTLTDEQKARFEAIGPQRTNQFESLEVTPTQYRRRGVPNVGQIIRRLLSPLGSIPSLEKSANG